MPHPRPLYSFFYSHLERNPEWGRFRRFTKEWAWMLNDNVHEIQAHMKACNAEVTRICGDRHSITDYHRAQANGPQLGLDRQILHFKTLLRQHGRRCSPLLSIVPDI